MIKAQIVTPWIVVDEHIGQINRPMVCNVYEVDWMDVTGQAGENIQTDPNLVVVEVKCDAATMAAIEADSRFFVLWSEE